MTIIQARKILGGKFFVLYYRGMRTVFKIECSECEQAWTLRAKRAEKPGNILHLLNHYAGHRATPEERARIKEEERRGLIEANQRLNNAFAKVFNL